MDHNRKLRGIQRKIETLGENEHGVLLNIISEAGVKCVHNQNGFFFNLVGLEDELVDKISEFVDFSISNNKALEMYDRDVHDKAQLLQRVPTGAPCAVQVAAVLKKGGKPDFQKRATAAPAEEAPSPPAKTTKLAFVRRATDPVRKAKVVKEEGLQFEAPLFLTAASK